MLIRSGLVFIVLERCLPQNDLLCVKTDAKHSLIHVLDWWLLQLKETYPFCFIIFAVLLGKIENV